MTPEPHWTEPGAFEVAAGVHRIPLPLPSDGLRAVNVYAVETYDGLTLVDGGWALEASRAQLDDALASLGRTVRDIRAFLVTHAHRDHYTQAAVIGREVGAHVSLGLGERPNLVAVREPEHPPGAVLLLRLAGAGALARQWELAADAGRQDLDVWTYPDTWLDGDPQLTVGSRTLQTLATPGHTRGHVVFADLADGLLFAGDHVLPTITPSIGFEPAPTPLPLGDFLASLAKVRALPDLRLLPAHGPVTTSTHARIDELVAHHDERLRLCEASLRAGRETSYDVAGDLPWTRHARSLAELDTFNAGLATMETMAHLELLAAQGRVTRSEVAGARTYRPMLDR